MIDIAINKNANDNHQSVLSVALKNALVSSLQNLIIVKFS